MTGLPDENWSGSIQPSSWSSPATSGVLPYEFEEPDPRTFWLHLARHPILYRLVKWLVLTVGNILQGAVLILGITLPWGYFDKKYLPGIGYFVVALCFFWAWCDHQLVSAKTVGFNNPSHAVYLMLRRCVRCGLALTAGYFAHAEAVRRGLAEWHPFAVWLGASLLVYKVASPLFHAAVRGPLWWLLPPRKVLKPSRPALWRDPAELRSPPV